MSAHDYTTPRTRGATGNTEQNEDDDDPVVSAIRRSGCLDEHYDVLDCMYEKKDWRACQDVLNVFKSCMNRAKHAKQ
ncbi:Coiled-coil-helix-coiled-coil-helix domain-containing protein 8 [Paragonimus heterotremus]|uniref:Coiled-coil-helix-coiled-coil-helix domain-containing protein 8 n=1 Tax=Paragonimus heterotremus TaxID=100268 RepID=A0A8J4SJQ3_9TREM|nr:Coiled-coil-helix-coiled-coil-helix domain-containing protein 8 [Paragonimus heterotremus]